MRERKNPGRRLNGVERGCFAIKKKDASVLLGDFNASVRSLLLVAYFVSCLRIVSLSDEA